MKPHWESMRYLLPHLLNMKDLGFEPSSLLDIGASVGHFVSMARHVWPGLSTVAVEENIACQASLEMLGVEAHMVGLSRFAGPERFYRTSFDPASMGCGYYRENTPAFSGPQGYSEERECTTLRAIFGERKFDLIKIDTQGSELDILRGGMCQFINAEVVICEASFLRYNEGAPLIDEVLEFFLHNRFHILGFAGPVDGCHMYGRRQNQTDIIAIAPELANWLEVPRPDQLPLDLESFSPCS